MIKKGFNIQQKIQIYILLSVVLIFLSAIGYLGFNARERMMQMSENLANSYAREYANLTASQLNYYATGALNLQTLFQGFDLIPHSSRRDVLSGYLQRTLSDNPRFLSVWGILEPYAIDTLAAQYRNRVGSTVLGNFRYVYYRSDNKVVLNNYVEPDASQVLSGEVYTIVKTRLKPTIINPYYYSYTGNKVDEILETNIVVPVLNGSEFIGVVGIDVPLSSIGKELNSYKPIEGAFAFLLSHTGALVSFPDETLVSKNISDIDFLSGYQKFDVNGELIKGPFAYTTTYHNETYYVASAPVHIAGTGIAWHVQMALPLSVVNQLAAKTIQNTIFVGLIGLFLIFVVITIVTRSIVRPIQLFTKVIGEISDGNVDQSLLVNMKSNDEIGEMGAALNKYIHGYVEKTDFASKIGTGELDAEFKLLSEHDKLGHSLIQMRNNLAKAKEEELKRREEDNAHRWANEGIALFADVLRQNNNDLSKLSFEIMRNLVNYLKVHQGAIFVVDESELDSSETYFDAIATIAFDRRQYNKTRIKQGEDLIGRCAHERKTIYLKDVPDDYVTINSGLGDARPNSILIVPAILNDKVYAILELASFHAIEQYQIEFVEKLSESVASTIANVKVSERTQLLLKESQHQREELSSQEEEMRQNLEELQTTQEEAARREFELRGLIEALSVSNYMVEYDLYGVITDVNERFSSLVGLSREQIIGMNHKEGLDLTGLTAQKYNQFWEDLRHGISRTEETHIRYNEKDLYLFETYTPLLDREDTPYKVVKISIDITDLRKSEQKLEAIIAESGQSKKQIDSLQAELHQLRDELHNKRTLIEQLQIELTQLKAAPNTSEAVNNVRSELPLPPAGEPLIEWNNSFDNEIGELNEQHKRIVELANQLYIGLRTDKPKKEIKEVLKMLVDYTAWHFSNEERYFEEFGFESAHNHSAQHRQFIAHLDDFRKTHQAGRTKFYDDVMRYIKTWIEEHFANVDKEYVVLFKENGLG